MTIKIVNYPRIKCPRVTLSSVLKFKRKVLDWTRIQTRVSSSVSWCAYTCAIYKNNYTKLECFYYFILHDLWNGTRSS